MHCGIQAVRRCKIDKKDAIVADRDAGLSAKDTAEKYNLSVNYVNQIYRQARGTSEFRRDDRRYAELLARVRTLEALVRQIAEGRFIESPRQLKKRGIQK